MSANPPRVETIAEPHWSLPTRRRIAAQGAIVARLTPGSADHRLATAVLLALQDSLHVLSEARHILDLSEARRVLDLSKARRVLDAVRDETPVAEADRAERLKERPT